MKLRYRIYLNLSKKVTQTKPAPQNLLKIHDNTQKTLSTTKIFKHTELYNPINFNAQ